MNIRKLKNEFKQDIYKEDLLPVLKNGLISAILYSCLFAMVNFALSLLLNLTTSYFIFLIGYFIARQIKSSHFKGHIVYQIISIIYLFLGMIIYNATTAFLLTFDPSLILYFLKYGFLSTINIFNIFAFNNGFFLNHILTLLIIIYTIYYTFKNSRNNI